MIAWNYPFGDAASFTPSEFASPAARSFIQMAAGERFEGGNQAGMIAVDGAHILVGRHTFRTRDGADG